MLDWIVKCLKDSGCDGWEVSDRKTRGWEFYFIGHRLDQNRARNTEHIQVKVYRKFDAYLGSASQEIPVTAEKEEVRKAIDLLMEEAQLIKNPVYELNWPEGRMAEKEKTADVEEISEAFLKTLNSVQETETEYVNSYEIFCAVSEVRFLNSNGVDVTYCYPSSMAEVVVNARDESKEIELYRMYKSGTCGGETLKRDIEETMRIGKDRLHTVKTPALGKYDVVFSTDAALQIYEYFTERMNTALKYQQLSDWEIGKPVESFEGKDRLTVKVRKCLPNSSQNSAYDREGAAIRDLALIDQGTAVNFAGPRQFSQYLGIEDSFMPGNYEICPGSESEEQLRSGSFLEVVEFSDFQVDSITGNIAGEIRLGYLHEGDEVRVVSGGSVSGNMHDKARTMRFSENQKQYDNFLVPAVTRLCGLTVSGAE